MRRSLVRALSIGMLGTGIVLIGSMCNAPESERTPPPTTTTKMMLPTEAAIAGSNKVYRIGWIGLGRAPTGTNSAAADFQQGLRDLGYVIDRNVVIDYRYADGNPDLLPALLTSVIALKVDVIVVAGEPAAFAAKRATRTVPIVVTEFGLDPVKAGLVGSLGRPEGNVTGLGSGSEDLWGKRLQLLRLLAPKVNRVATLWNPGSPRNQACVEQLKAGGSALRIQFREYEVRDARTLDHAFVAIGKAPTDAIAICWDSATHDEAKPIADFALARRLPTIAPLKEYAQTGALLSLGASLPAERRRSAYYVSRILKGAKPSELPIELPTMYELILNKRTVQSLGIAVPPAFAALIDDLVE